MARYASARYCVLALLLTGTPVCAQRTYEVVDVQRVPLKDDPTSAIVRFTVPPRVSEINCDFLIAGAGMGGVAAALRASERGHSVCLTEETDWIGGQATAGGVSALDENRFIEIAGGTRSYYRFRDGIRDYYRQHYKLSPRAAVWENLNPGSCYVSALCFEPKAGLSILESMLAGHPVQLFLRTAIVDLERAGDRIVSALAWRFDTAEAIRFRSKLVLDATELGDLLPLAKVPYVAGSESKSDTREPHASGQPNSACVQSFTYPFAIERRDGEHHTIPKPPGYAEIVRRQAFSLRVNYAVEYGWKGEIQYGMYGEDPPVPNNMSPGPFFPWRRLLDARNFAGVPAHDVALMNWPRQDFAAESILDRNPQDFVRILREAKRTSIAFLYWLQQDMGHPELMLRRDVMGTADGLSKYPYIRESRRVRARERVVEQDIVDEYQTGPRARWFANSVGTGFYMVDIHPCGMNERGRMMMPKPFQIPMAALLPEGVSNFLPAGKNIGVTHLTNGAFRLHPIEWNVGESAAVIGSLAIKTGAAPDVLSVQRELALAGVSLVWFDDLPVKHPGFAGIQLSAIRGAYPLGRDDLHASPDAPVTRAEAARMLAVKFGRDGTADAAVKLARNEGWMVVDHRNWFHGDLPFYWSDIREAKLPHALAPVNSGQTGPVRRWEIAQRLFAQ